MKTVKQSIPFKFVLFASLVLIAIFVIENINHRFWLNDFRVYYSAAQAFIGGTQVYGTLFALGSGYYKYSPFTLILVLPLCLFPFNVACIIEYFFLAVSIICLFIVAWHIINNYLFDDKLKNRNAFLIVAFVCVVNHLVRELHLGNINVVLLMLLCFSLLFVLQKRFVLAGVLLAVVIITKPFFILLLLPLFLRKNYKTLFSFCISILFFVINPALVTGFPRTIELHKEWIRTMIEHNSSFPSSNTIESLLKLYIVPGASNSIQYVVMIAVCIGYLFFFYNNRKAERKNNNDMRITNANLIIEWFLLIAIMPSLFKTDTQHFLLSLPLIMIILFYLSTSGNYFLIAGFIVLMFFYGGNSSDFLGRVFSERLSEAGALGISNLLLLFWTIAIHFNLRRKEISM